MTSILPLKNPNDAGSKRQNEIYAELAVLLSPETVLRRGEPLAKKTTLRVGGCAEFFIEPRSEAELAGIASFCHRNSLPLFVLGRGSNLLIKDSGIRGVVVSMSHPSFSRIEIADGKLTCGAGAKLKNVAVEARRANLTGLEFLEGIPGSVGGSIRMNAGAMGGAIFDAVEKVRYVSGKGDLGEKTASQLNPQYRSCAFFSENTVVAAVIKGKPANHDEIAGKMTQYSEKRWGSQPAAPSAGCIFKNPTTIPAGKLIEELGLKGERVGGAVVSDVHGNFIVNEGNATAADVLELISRIKKIAKERRGIELETEVQIIGE